MITFSKSEIGKKYTLTITHHPINGRPFQEVISAIIEDVDLLGETDQLKSVTVNQIIGIDHYLNNELDKVTYVTRTFYRGQVTGKAYRLGYID